MVCGSVMPVCFHADSKQTGKVYSESVPHEWHHHRSPLSKKQYVVCCIFLLLSWNLRLLAQSTELTTLSNLARIEGKSCRQCKRNRGQLVQKWFVVLHGHRGPTRMAFHDRRHKIGTSCATETSEAKERIFDAVLSLGRSQRNVGKRTLIFSFRRSMSHEVSKDDSFDDTRQMIIG